MSEYAHHKNIKPRPAPSEPEPEVSEGTKAEPEDTDALDASTNKIPFEQGIPADEGPEKQNDCGIARQPVDGPCEEGQQGTEEVKPDEGIAAGNEEPV